MIHSLLSELHCPPVWGPAPVMLKWIHEISYWDRESQGVISHVIGLGNQTEQRDREIVFRSTNITATQYVAHNRHWNVQTTKL